MDLPRVDKQDLEGDIDEQMDPNKLNRFTPKMTFEKLETCDNSFLNSFVSSNAFSYLLPSRQGGLEVLVEKEREPLNVRESGLTNFLNEKKGINFSIQGLNKMDNDLLFSSVPKPYFSGYDISEMPMAPYKSMGEYADNRLLQQGYEANPDVDPIAMGRNNAFSICFVANPLVKADVVAFASKAL